MGISFHILPDRGLVYVHYVGTINVADSMRAFIDYMSHPAYRHGQRQLVDLAEATGWDPDFPNLMALQAKKAEALFNPEQETLFVYHAPDARTRAIARMVLRAWDGIDAVVPRIIDTEHDALAVLGQPERSFAEMLQSA